MDGDKNYLSPTKLSSSFLKMLRKRRRRHSMPVATDNTASMASSSSASKQSNLNRKMIAEKPLNQDEEFEQRKKGRQRCVTESIFYKISRQNGKSKNQ